MKYLVFIFKRRFRRSALNNFLSVKKVKDVSIINLSGPILYLVGKLLYFFLRSKKVIFISCDGEDYLYREANSINLWMGGTTNKIPVLIKGLIIILFQQALYLLMKLNCSPFFLQIYLKVESMMNTSLFTFLKIKRLKTKIL